MPGPKPRDASMAGPYQRLAEKKRFTAARRLKPEAAAGHDRMDTFLRVLPWLVLAGLVALRVLAVPPPIPALEPLPAEPSPPKPPASPSP
jgi:hypothetical protein